MEIFKAMLQAEQANLATRDLEGRSFGVTFAVVADIEDPLRLNRVRVMLPNNGAKTLSDWLVRVTPTKFYSAPLVSIGDLVLVSFVNGDPKNGCYFGHINNVPQPPAVDTSATVTAQGDTGYIQTNDSITLVAGQSSFKLTKDGTLEISGVSSVTINGQQVATVNAVDTDGDRIVSKGWS